MTNKNTLFESCRLATILMVPLHLRCAFFHLAWQVPKIWACCLEALGRLEAELINVCTAASFCLRKHLWQRQHCFLESNSCSRFLLLMVSVYQSFTRLCRLVVVTSLCSGNLELLKLQTPQACSVVRSIKCCDPRGWQILQTLLSSQLYVAIGECSDLHLPHSHISKNL